MEAIQWFLVALSLLFNIYSISRFSKHGRAIDRAWNMVCDAANYCHEVKEVVNQTGKDMDNANQVAQAAFRNANAALSLSNSNQAEIQQLWSNDKLGADDG